MAKPTVEPDFDLKKSTPAPASFEASPPLCILQARIDPGLSIDAYYRSQEAKGIQATPKADDFDDIHRRDTDRPQCMGPLRGDIPYWQIEISEFKA